MGGVIKLGATLERKLIVRKEDCISFLGGDVKPSLASPRMIGHMEFAARDAVLPHLEDGQDTVGTRVDVAHLGATPLGDEVTYTATVTALEGNKVTFDVEATDSRDTVGRGIHERYVIDVERFARGLRKKFGQE
jgi:predicted thioesterase